MEDSIINNTSKGIFKDSISHTTTVLSKRDVMLNRSVLTLNLKFIFHRHYIEC